MVVPLPDMTATKLGQRTSLAASAASAVSAAASPADFLVIPKPPNNSSSFYFWLRVQCCVSSALFVSSCIIKCFQNWMFHAILLHTYLKITTRKYPHCVYSLLIPFKEDVPTFLIYCYSMIDQQLLLKQFCSNRLSFWDSLLTSTANPAQTGRTGCAG